MKYSIFFILLFFFVGINTVSFAQQNDSTTIKITLPTTEDWKIADTVSLEYFNPIFSELKTTIYFDRIDSIKNEWSVKIPISKPTRYSLAIKRKNTLHVLILPNDEVDFLINEQGNFRFLNGKIVKENEFEYRWREQYNYASLVKYDWKEFASKMDSMTQKHIEEYELTFKEDKPNPIFDAYFRNEIKASHNYAFSYYPFFHNRYHQKKELVATLPQEYFDIQPKMPYKTISKNSIDSYYTSSVVMGVFYTLAQEENCQAEQGKVYEFDNFYCTYQQTDSISTSRLKKLVALYALNFMIKKTEKNNLSQTEIIDKAFMSLENEFPDDEDINYLKNKVHNSKRFAKGQPATDFTLKDENGQLVSLSDFKGKYVLIDFFSAWCKPCIAERPYSEKLEKEFADKNIVFLNVCIDSKESVWGKVLDKMPLEGTELYAEDKESKEIRKAYNIEGASAYFFLDKEGNFISTNARPSQNAKQIIEKALSEEK